MIEKHRNSAATNDFHESFAAGTVALPSPRATGLVFTAIAVIVAAIFRDNLAILILAIGAAAALLAASVLSPQLLQPLNIVWFKFGMLLHRIVNPVVMFAMFAIAFLPMGLLMQAIRDPMRLKRQHGLATYWLEPDAAEIERSSMKNQF